MIGEVDAVYDRWAVTSRDGLVPVMTSTDNYSSQGSSRGCKCRGQARLRQADAVSAWKGFQVQNNDNLLGNLTWLDHWSLTVLRYSYIYFVVKSNWVQQRTKQNCEIYRGWIKTVLVIKFNRNVDTCWMPTSTMTQSSKDPREIFQGMKFSTCLVSWITPIMFL